MESAGLLLRGSTAPGVRGARIAHAGWALWLTAHWARAVSWTLFRVQSHRPGADVESYFHVTMKVSWGIVIAAEVLLAAALVPLARSLADRRTRLLLWVACGAAVGDALMTAVALATPVSQPFAYLLEGSRAAAPALFVWASARVLRSSDARVSSPLLGAALLALVVRAGEVLTRDLPSGHLLPWALREVDGLATSLPVISAYFLVRHVRRASGEIAPRRAGDPYRVAEQGEDDAADHERRRKGHAAADRLGIHSGAVCAYGATAAAGILLSAYQESWHRFYAQAEVVMFTSALDAAALFVMVIAIPRHRAAGRGTTATFAGRWLTLLALALEVAAYAMMSSASQPLAPTPATDDDFTRLIVDRQVRFNTAVGLAFLGKALTLVAIAQLGFSFERVAASAHQPALARRASHVATLVGLLAALLVVATVLANNGPGEVMIALGPLKRSWIVQAALAGVVLVITAEHALTARGVAGFLEGAESRLAPERDVSGEEP